MNWERPAVLTALEKLEYFFSFICRLQNRLWRRYSYFVFKPAGTPFYGPTSSCAAETLKVLTQGLASFTVNNSVDYGPMMAATVCATIPVLIVFLFAQKLFHTKELRFQAQNLNLLKDYWKGKVYEAIHIVSAPFLSYRCRIYGYAGENEIPIMLPLSGEVLELIEHEPRFKWNCESYWCVEQFLKEATPEETQAFVRAVKKGNIGLSASYLNLTDLVPEYVHQGIMDACTAQRAVVGNSRQKRNDG